MAQGKKYEPNEADRQLVQQMAAVGIRHEQIAAVLKLSADTLVKYYDEELKTAKTKANMKIAGTLYNKAMKGDTTCMIFWLKTQAQWNETQHIVHENKQYVISDEVLSIDEFDKKYNVSSVDTTAETEEIN
jgi:hypothetical protein